MKWMVWLWRLSLDLPIMYQHQYYIKLSKDKYQISSAFWHALKHTKTHKHQCTQPEYHYTLYQVQINLSQWVCDYITVFMIGNTFSLSFQRTNRKAPSEMSMIFNLMCHQADNSFFWWLGHINYHFQTLFLLVVYYQPAKIIECIYIITHTNDVPLNKWTLPHLFLHICYLSENHKKIYRSKNYVMIWCLH